MFQHQLLTFSAVLLLSSMAIAQTTAGTVELPPPPITSKSAAIDKNAPTVRMIDPTQPVIPEIKTINPEDFTDTGTLQGLDKVTARVSTIKLSIGKTTKFGNLEITLHSCWRAPAEEEPESKGLIEITEQVPGEKKTQRFHGWMFASSPALSTLEHPVYDITLISCTSSKDAPAPAIPSEKILNKPLEIENLQDLD